MSGYVLKWVGALLVAAAIVFASREYSRYAKRRISECESFLSLLRHVKGEINRFLSTPSAIFKSYSDENLERVGFLALQREGKSLYECFEGCRCRLSIPERIKDKLSRFFYGFGENYKDGEISRTEYYIDEIEPLLREEWEALPDRIKLVRTLAAAISLGLIILVL